MVKRIILVALIFAFFWQNLLVAQEISKSDDVNYKNWQYKMQNPDADLDDVVKSFGEYWKDKEITRGCGWKPFKRLEYMNKLSAPHKDLNLPFNYVQKEYSSFLSKYGHSKVRGNWVEMGPFSTPSKPSASQPNGVGRINTMAFHPLNRYIMFAGAPSGGLWITRDEGASWSSMTDDLPTLGVSSILINPTNPYIMYLGTGDRDSQAWNKDAPGLGIMKSTNGGYSWNFANMGMDANATVGAMVMHPANSNIIIAATSSGIYKTTNGGSSWQQTFFYGYFTDIKYHPTNSSIVYATERGSFYRSTNGGSSWNLVNVSVSGTRAAIGVSKNQPDVVYFLQTNNDVFAALLKSTNAGLTFTTQSTTPNIMDYSCNGSGNSGQAGYDLCLAVDPNNANTIYVGSINVWKSTDGGKRWNIKTHWNGQCGVALHADQHYMTFSPYYQNRLYVGNDAGLHYSDNGASSWTEINNGLAIAQIYKIGQSVTNKDFVMNGYQDNGTALRTKDKTYETVMGGDGMECIIDYTNTNYVYGSVYYGQISRDAGWGFANIAGEYINGITEKGAWVTPYALNLGTPSTMYIGYKNIWRSTNVKSWLASWVKWKKISNWSVGAGTDISVVETSNVNTDLLYCVKNNQLYRSENVNASTPTWATCSMITYGNITSLKAHPVYQNTLYATNFGGVYKSVNKGASWTNITGNLPAIGVYSITVDVSLAGEHLYVGTDAGVYYYNGSTWAVCGNGLPVNVKVTELDILYSGDARLRAATYGRGLWELVLHNIKVDSEEIAEDIESNENCEDITASNIYNDEKDGITIYSGRQKIYVKINSDEAVSGTVEIINLAGVVLYKQSIDYAQTTKFMVQKSGIYIVRVIKNGKSHTDKVYVSN